ncbi:beta/gamma crystallin family protein [Paenibacillus allorhizosphaerae]|uniref:Uncharacterized protein n=1 Tax=Paenibacillus allorhizosphaerae TaxID=2849866 RepID=A0ABN7TPF1_9BACL|nr:beta/gamma crystallin family protein [Paenibacillus allorhizosphaerae]CAG7639393.1 hypothetical protein PAECIP111802_02539 [Paenibacillus allorhizosphaerae]
MANRDVRISLFADTDFEGRRIRFSRGGAAVRDARALGFNGVLSSFRLQNVVDSREVTLVLWSQTNFRGTRRVFRGNMNVNDLGSFDNRMSSFIVVGRRLTNAQIDSITNNNRPPQDIVVIQQ